MFDMVKYLDSNNVHEISSLNEPLFLVPILSDHKKHWTLNQISFIYIYGLDSHSEYVFGVNHNDVFNHNIQTFPARFSNLVYSYKSKYIIDFSDVYDAELLYWFCTNESMAKINIDFRIQQIYYHRTPNESNINDCIPIVKWLEYCRNLKDIFILEYKKFEKKSSYDLYFDLIFCNLVKIEKNGKILSEYNPFTITGRPSNSFNDVNYAALPKHSDIRKSITGNLIEVDFKAYHLFLISKLIGWDWDGKDIYNEFAKYYYDVDVPEQYQIDFIKTEMFRNLYGKVDDKFLNHPFLIKVHNLIDDLWYQYQTSTVKTFIFERELGKIPNLNPTKLFNYLIQNLETEYNGVLLNNLFEYLENKKTKVILYTYDAILFDYHYDDGPNFINDLKNIFKDIPYRIKYGKNYNDLKAA